MPLRRRGTPIAPCRSLMLPPPLRHAPPTIVAGIPVARQRTPRPSRDLTLVLGAIPQETDLVEWALSKKKRGKLADFPYLEGRIDARRVVVAITGIGKTCAAMITALFVEKFRPREVLLCGTASR